MYKKDCDLWGRGSNPSTLFNLKQTRSPVDSNGKQKCREKKSVEEICDCLEVTKLGQKHCRHVHVKTLFKSIIDML